MPFNDVHVADAGTQVTGGAIGQGQAKRGYGVPDYEMTNILEGTSGPTGDTPDTGDGANS
jgi:hypothetical protein